LSSFQFCIHMESSSPDIVCDIKKPCNTMSHFSHVPPPSSADLPSRQGRSERPSSSQQVSLQRQDMAPMRCKKCMKPLNATVFLLKCECLICEGTFAASMSSLFLFRPSCCCGRCLVSYRHWSSIACAETHLSRKSHCPCCNFPISSDHDLKEFLITSQTEKETPEMTLNEIKKAQYQWMFVKQDPKARGLTTNDMYRRLLMQHAKHRDTVRFVLKQMLSQYTFIETRCAQFEQAFQNYGQRENALKQEIHKCKETVCSRDKKIEDLQRQLEERNDLIAKYRKMISPTTPQRAPRPSMEPLSLIGKHPRVGNENLPPMSSHRMDYRSSPVVGAYDRYAPPESSRGLGFGIDPLRPRSLPRHGHPYPLSQPFADGRQRLPTPTQHIIGGVGPYSGYDGGLSTMSPLGSNNHSIDEYSRSSAHSDRRATPTVVNTINNNVAFTLRVEATEARLDRMAAGEEFFRSTPFSFTGYARNKRHHESSRGSAGYDRR
jgi:hypothetical protein